MQVSHYFDSDPTKLVAGLREDGRAPAAFIADTTTANAQVRCMLAARCNDFLATSTPRVSASEACGPFGLISSGMLTHRRCRSLFAASLEDHVASRQHKDCVSHAAKI